MKTICNLFGFSSPSNNLLVTGFYLISDSVFGILMILFAGGWSDKRGKRKPCMLIPMIGELAALIGR